MSALPKSRDVSVEASSHGELFGLAMGLAGVLVAVKILLLEFPVSTVTEFVRWTLRLGIVCSADICFLAGLTLLCAVCSRCAQPWPKLYAAWRGAVRAVLPGGVVRRL